MMKKLITFLVILFALFFVRANFVSAEIATQSSTPTEINYELPYPGILPDSPLYFIKTLRDRIISILINDQFKRAEFELLTSDKRLAASLALANKGKDALAVTTFSKSNNYFKQAIDSTLKAKEMGKNIDSLRANLPSALKKHEDVLKSITTKLDSQYKNQLDEEKRRLGVYEKLVRDSVLK